MRKCRQCGFPRKFARYFDWRSDGTIISTDSTKTTSQITFLESGELESIFDELSTVIGIPADPFMIKAQKNIGKAIYANLPIRHMKRVPSNRYMRPQFLARLLVRLMAPDIAGLGDGRITLDEYTAGVRLVIRFKNPCVVPLLVGSSVGIYESVEDMPSADVDYSIEDGDLVVRLTHSTTRGDSDERLYLEPVVPGKGPLSMERCSTCGAPWVASRTFEWDIDQGIIGNRMSGEREVIVSVQSVNAFLRELESELGEEVVGVLYDVQLKHTLGRLGSEKPVDLEDFWTDKLAELALRGLGYPLKFERSVDTVSVEIGNAYNQVLYAAKLAASLQKASGRQVSIEWSEREQDHGSYTLRAT